MTAARCTDMICCETANQWLQSKLIAVVESAIPAEKLAGPDNYRKAGKHCSLFKGLISLAVNQF